MAHVESTSRAAEATVTITMTVTEARRVNAHLINSTYGNGRVETASVQRAISDGVRRAEGR